MKPIVILEMANNHMGSILHAKKIIESFSSNLIIYLKNLQIRKEITD